ncbi:hypothetical protein KP509_10G015400 [Ceratopteris richardii]|nr:hypothetical protein KP509_10G015400 [Ceratopteris richardii]KAH7426744.1 hypothetical protein KP509_10G015400 [Ceratopteris richardii]
MFSFCGSLRDAYLVFNTLSVQNVFTWSAIISAFAIHGEGHQAYKLFKDMLQSGIKPDTVVFVVSLKACASLKSLARVNLLHFYAIYAGFDSNIYVANTLIALYASLGSIMDGCTVFDGLSKQDVASWNAMIAAHLQHGNVTTCAQLFQQMQKEGIKPNNVTCISIIKAASYSTIVQTRFAHIQATELDLELDVYVASSLLDAYARQGAIDDAQELFDRLPAKDVVTWSALIAGYVQNGYDWKAFLLFQKMQYLGVKEDNFTYVSVLNACSNTAAAEEGELIHACLIEAHLKLDTFIGSALIGMYSCHGKLEDVECVFGNLAERDIGVWNALIESCTTNDNYELAMYYLNAIQLDSLLPDAVTFVCLLSLCSHMGLIEEGWYQLKLMIGQYGLSPMVEHYNCLIDLFGRLGQLQEAENLLQNMPWQPTLRTWMSLLSNCRTFCNVTLGFYCFKKIFLLDGTHASAYTLMYPLFLVAGLNSDAMKLIELRNKMQARRKPGKAYIEVAQNIHEFVVGDNRHPSILAYRKLKSLLLHLNSEGFMPLLDLLNI